MKQLTFTIKSFVNCRSVNQIHKKLCGKLIGQGTYRDVYECKINPDFVVKIERDPATGAFANVSEWRNYNNYKDWNFLKPWMAPCILINETGQVMLQAKVSREGKRRKDYPKYIPSVFTDTKLANFGWIGDAFVCCDYSFFAIYPGKKSMKYAKWWGSLKNKNKNVKRKKS